MEIIPSIIAKDFSEVKAKLAQLDGLVDWVELDIMDGVFVPNLTWPFSEMRQAPADLNSLTDKLKISAHLMVSSPETVVDDWWPVADRLMFHLESSDQLGDLLARFKLQTDLGLVLELKTPVSELAPYFADIKYLQLMSIKQAGFSGEIFDEAVFAKIAEIKRLAPELKIIIDGGVNLENGQRLAEVGVSGLVVGSQIWTAPNIEEAIKNFQDL